MPRKPRLKRESRLADGAGDDAAGLRRSPYKPIYLGNRCSWRRSENSYVFLKGGFPTFTMSTIVDFELVFKMLKKKGKVVFSK